MIINFSNKTKTTNKKQLDFIYFKDKINKLKKEGETIYDFSIGDPTSKKDPIVLENIEKAVKKYENAGYPKYGGEEEFLIAISKYMKRRFNVDFDYKTEICVTNGVKTALDYFSQIIINNGDLSICPTPSYPPYINNTKDYGGEVILLPLLEAKSTPLCTALRALNGSVLLPKGDESQYVHTGLPKGTRFKASAK